MAAKLKDLPSVKIDLSKLPADVQAAVGPEIAQALVKQLSIGDTALIVGKLGIGLYGFINPEFLEEKAAGDFAALLKSRDRQ